MPATYITGRNLTLSINSVSYADQASTVTLERENNQQVLEVLSGRAYKTVDKTATLNVELYLDDSSSAGIISALWDAANSAPDTSLAFSFDVFRAVANTIEENDVLLHKVKAIRYTNGQESITLKDNSRYEIVAATRDGSRGKHADLLFIDELREISVEGFQAAVPTTRARPNAMSLYCSNAGCGQQYQNP